MRRGEIKERSGGSQAGIVLERGLRPLKRRGDSKLAGRRGSVKFPRHRHTKAYTKKKKKSPKYKDLVPKDLVFRVSDIPRII